MLIALFILWPIIGVFSMIQGMRTQRNIGPEDLIFCLIGGFIAGPFWLIPAGILTFDYLYNKSMFNKKVLIKKLK
jgi:hypothetical protein